jgi:hypothetical protein
MAVILRVEEIDVDGRLAGLRLSRAALIDAIRACVAAYGGCTDNDPPSARGYEPWRYGTRHLRELLLPADLDWKKDDTANLSSVRNDDVGIRIIVLNTDERTGSLTPEPGPQNRLKKGILHERAIGSTTGWLPGLPKLFDEPQHDVWYLCVHVSGEKVLAELSRPAAIENGFIVGWKERIIIVGPDDWAKLDFSGIEDDSGPDFEINVRRK